MKRLLTLVLFASLGNSAIAAVEDPMVPLPPGAVRFQGFFQNDIENSIVHWNKGAVPYAALVQMFRTGRGEFAQGEMWGKAVRSGCMFYRYTQDPELKRILQKTVADLLTTRRSNGSISCSDVSRQPDGPGGDLWERKYVLLGLDGYYRWVEKDPAVLQAMVDEADCTLAQIGPPPKTRIVDQGWSPNHIESSTILEPIMRLYNLTGEKRYLEFARYIVEVEGGAKGCNLIEDAFNDKDPEQIGGVYPKAYEMMSLFEGLVEYYRVTGNERWKRATLNLYRKIREQEITIVGNGGGDQPYHPAVCGEAWDRTAFEQTNPAITRMMETCAGVTWLKLCSQILRLTGDPAAVDAIEQYAYNGLLGAQKPEGDGFSYVNLLNGVKTNRTGWGAEIGGVYVTCCNLNGPMGLAYLPFVAVMNSRTGPVVNLYNAGTATASTPSGRPVRLEITTDYPRSGSVTIGVWPEVKERFSIRLRIPAWSKAAALKVAGEPTAVAPGTYAAVDRVWSPGDRIELGLDMRCRVIDSPRGSNRAGDHRQALVRGPIVLARDENIDPDYDKPVAILTNNGVVDATPTRPTLKSARMQFRIPTRTGSIEMVDYASVNNWNGKHVCTWLPKAEAVASASPFRDAVAVWHMGSPANAIEPNCPLTVKGDVTLGVELTGADREASLRRGGDGRAARFSGGLIVAGQDAVAPFKVTGKQMTLCLRIRDPEGRWNTGLLARRNPSPLSQSILSCTKIDPEGLFLREARRIHDGRAVEFLWHSDTFPTGDGKPREMRLAGPIELAGPTAWHDLVVRFNGPNLELFIDGVLIDENWPHGTLLGFESPLLIGAASEATDGPRFQGLIDHVAVWNRALGDDEITTLSGGAMEVERRTNEILGPEPEGLQYWRPRGYNTFVGDCMPFYHDGTFHLFYLFDRRHHGSKWGAGGHQFAHAATKDLVHWTHYPLAIPITSQHECSIGTGNCVYFNGTYYMFYVEHGRRIAFPDSPYRGDNVFVATSNDGIHFVKQPKPVVTMSYSDAGDVNPLVFPDGSGKRFFMIVSTVNSYVSDDLVHWTETKELASLSRQMRSADGNYWSCCSYFHWNQWRYFSSICRYRMSKSPAEKAQWLDPEVQGLDDNVAVPEIAAFTGNRFLCAGFLGGLPYGTMTVFRELVQHPDGTLGMKFPAEMVPSSGPPIRLDRVSADDGASGDAQTLRIAAGDAVKRIVFSGLPRNARITLRAKAATDTQEFGLAMRAKTIDGPCNAVFLRPRDQQVQIDHGPQIRNVPGLDGTITLDIVVKDDWVDVCVDNRRTLIGHVADLDGDQLVLFCKNGEVAVDGLEVRPLR